MAKTTKISKVDNSTTTKDNLFAINGTSSSDSIHLSTFCDQYLSNKDNISTKSLQIEMNKFNFQRPKKNSDPLPLNDISAILNEPTCSINSNANSKHSFKNDFLKNKMKIVNFHRQSTGDSDSSLSHNNETCSNFIDLLNGNINKNSRQHLMVNNIDQSILKDNQLVKSKIENEQEKNRNEENITLKKPKFFNTETQSSSSSEICSSIIRENKTSKRRIRANNFFMNIISMPYLQRFHEFYQLFGDNIGRQILIGDFYCALNAVQGRLYLSRHHFSFHYNIMGLFTKSLTWNCNDVVSISKENTALLIPNAIQIVVKASSLDQSINSTAKNLKPTSQSVSSTALLLSSNTVATAVIGVSTNTLISKFNNNDNNKNININTSNTVNSKEQNEQKYFFTSFTQRDKTFALMETIWKRTNCGCPLSNEEIKNTVHKLYGDNLGFETDFDEQLFFNNFDDLEQPVNKLYMDTTNKTNNNSNIFITESFKIENISEKYNSSLSPLLFSSTSIEKLDNNYNNKHSGVDAQEIALPLSEVNIKTKKNDTVQSNNISKTLAMTFTTNADLSPNTFIGTKPKEAQLLKCGTNMPSVKSFTIKSNAKSLLDSNMQAESSNEIKNKLSNPALELSPSRSLNKFLQNELISTVEGSCICTQHNGTVIMEQILPFAVDYVFEVLFVNQKLFRHLHKKRETSSIKIGPWIGYEKKYKPVVPLPSGNYDLEQCECRTLKYIVKINGVPLVKNCEVYENQYLLQSDYNQAYCLLSQVKNQGIPYSDLFFAYATWCLTACFPINTTNNRQACSNNDNQSMTIRLPIHTKLLIHFDIHYIKNSIALSLIKSSLEKNSRLQFQEVLNETIKLLLSNQFECNSRTLAYNEQLTMATDSAIVVEGESESTSSHQSEQIYDKTLINHNHSTNSFNNIALNDSMDGLPNLNNMDTEKIINGGWSLISIIMIFLRFTLKLIGKISSSTLSEALLMKILIIIILMVVLFNFQLLRQFYNLETRLNSLIDLIETVLNIDS